MDFEKMKHLKYVKLADKLYQVVEDIYIFVPELAGVFINKHPFIISLGDGWLCIKVGYVWNGANGVPHNRDNMRASLFHDALYELIALGLLDRQYRDVADQLLRRICLEDGMGKFWADKFYDFVHAFGDSHTQQKSYEVIEI